MKLKSIIIIVSFVALMIMLMIICNKSEYNDILNLELGFEFSGVITLKYIDHKSHGDYVIILDSINRVSLSSSPDCFQFVQVGDSIIKKKGELEYKVFRINTKEVFYPTINNEVIKSKTEK